MIGLREGCPQGWPFSEAHHEWQLYSHIEPMTVEMVARQWVNDVDLRYLNDRYNEWVNSHRPPAPEKSSAWKQAERIWYDVTGTRQMVWSMADRFHCVIALWPNQDEHDATFRARLAGMWMTDQQAIEWASYLLGEWERVYLRFDEGLPLATALLEGRAASPLYRRNDEAPGPVGLGGFVLLEVRDPGSPERP